MTVSPGHLADRPATPADPSQTHDLLSELLRSVRLSGERMVAYAPPQTVSIGFAGVGSLHIIEEGELVLRIDGDPDVQHITGGDVVLLPRGDAHHLSDSGQSARSIARAGAAESDAPEPARWLCGTFTIGDRQASHLLGSLPALIILRGARGPALEGLEVARRMLVVEMQSPSQGSAVMVARILDLLFIQILRAWAAGTDAEPNWLAGALDPQTAPALSAIHRDPSRDWTVEHLAERAASPGRRSLRGSSRTSARRQPPISPTYAWTLPPACCATPPFRSRSSRRTSDTHRRRPSAAHSRAATARRLLAGDETRERMAPERRSLALRTVLEAPAFGVRLTEVPPPETADRFAAG